MQQNSQIHLRWDAYWPLGGQHGSRDILIYVLVSLILQDFNLYIHEGSTGAVYKRKVVTDSLSVHSVFVDDSTAEWAIIANNVMSTLRWLFVILWANLFSFQSYIIRLVQENPNHLLQNGVWPETTNKATYHT